MGRNPQLQIVRSVVRADTVLMMHGLAFPQWPAQKSGHHEAVLHDVVASVEVLPLIDSGKHPITLRRRRVATRNSCLGSADRAGHFQTLAVHGAQPQSNVALTTA